MLQVSKMWRKNVALAAFVAVLAIANGKVALRRKGITMLPSEYTTVSTMDGPTYKYDEGAGEQLTLDKSLKIAYVVGETGIMHVVNLEDSSNLQVVKAVQLPQGATDVEMCGDHVAVAVEGATKTANGHVIIYEKYTTASPGMVDVQTLETGPLPDMIKFKSDCTVLLTADEGEGEWTDDTTFVNPPGTVTMFEFANGDLTATPTKTTLTFDAIAGDKDDPTDDKATALFEAGVGWQLGPHTPGLPAAYPTEAKSLTRNLEPEYIAFSADESKAYICLQEASAIATVDLATKAIVSVDAMGEKDWKTLDLKFDASNRDDGINMQVWPVVGRYMPDTIATFTVGGVDYIATANEGDVIEYGVDTDNEFACEMRGDDVADKLDDSINSCELAASLRDDSKLGRLKFECSCGLTAEGKYDKLCALSTRSWSIFKADTMELVWDSGSDVEDMMKRNHPEIFNADAADPGDSHADEMDSRSDDKGAEVETLAVGVIDGKTLIFVGLERTSTVMVYDASDPTAPVFHSSMRLSAMDAVPAALDDGTNAEQAIHVGVIDPEAMYVDETARQLVIAGSVSGTIAVYDIVMDELDNEDMPILPVLEQVRLSRDGIIMLPSEYDTVDTMTAPMYKYDKGAGEQMIHDAAEHIVYIVGETAIMHVVDISDTKSMSIKKAIQLPQGATDVEMCGDHVAVAVEGATKTANGHVIIYEKYTTASPGMVEVQRLETGPLPDMIKFKKDCTVLLTADEGEGEWTDATTFVNPPGTVTMFEFANGDLTATPTKTTLTFDAIAGDKDDPTDDKATALFQARVGWQLGPHTPGLPAAYPTEAKSLTRNLEPEYIAFSADESKAYICLQEASAIATVDLATKAIVSVDAMGEKNWKTLDLKFDASNRDDGINRQVWPVVGRYMPDTIATFTVGGVDYIATANEGDVIEYGVDTDNEFACELRGDDMADMLDASIDAEPLKSDLADDAKLGRLKFECSCGLTAEGKYNKLCALSTRSWSIFKADTMELVWDSGSDVEDVMQLNHPEIFNADAADPGDSHADEMDSRSDDKGAEVETLAVGVIDGKTLIFVGLERTSTVMVYDASDPTAPVFHSSMRLSAMDVVPAALEDGTATEQAMAVGVIDPEAMYVDSANKKLIVAGSVSGTLAVFTIHMPEMASGDDMGDDDEEMDDEAVTQAAVTDRVTLRQLGIVMLPAEYADVSTMATPMYKYDEGAGEQMILDKAGKIVYVVGETGIMHVVDIQDPADMQVVKAVELPQGATDVEMCGEFVAVAVEGASKTENGHVIIYEKYTPSSTGMSEVQTLETGPLPDMIKFKKDCTVLLTADEGEGAWVDGTFVNPPGTVTMFEFANGDLTATPTKTTLTFDAIAGDKDDPTDDKATALFEKRVGWQLGPHTPGLPAAYPTEAKSLTRNLEPEYIAFSADESKAYICLQEASAIATVDLATKAIVSVDAMGEKDWKTLGLAFDASNRDDGINRQVWPVVGRYMPDTIATFTVGGVDYIATANEGDVIEYGVDTDNEFACELRGGDLVTSLDDSIDSYDMQVSLCDDEQLGRLKFECSCGLTAEGKYDKLCALSTRSWSIFQADNMKLVWDSGSDVEKVMAAHHPEIFNADAADPGDSHADEMDSRSDDKGAEVETLAVGVIDGKTLIFVGLERTSTVMVYDASDPMAPVFHSSMRLSGTAAVPAALADGTATPMAEEVGVIDPEAMYVDEDSQLLYVAGSVSGTVAVYAIDLPKTLDDLPEQNGVKVLEVAGETGSMVSFAPSAFPAGAQLKAYEEVVDNTVSPAPGTLPAATKALRFFSSVAPTAAVKFVLKVISGSRRADTDTPIVHWLDERTNEWQVVCDTTAETTGEVSAELSPTILSSPGFDPATGCDTALSTCVRGDGGYIAAFYIDESVCAAVPPAISLPKSSFTPEPEDDGGQDQSDVARITVATIIGVVGGLFALVMIYGFLFGKADEPVKKPAAPQERDLEIAEAPVKTVDPTPPAATEQPPAQAVSPAVPSFTPMYQGPYPPPQQGPPQQGFGMPAPPQQGFGMPATALPQVGYAPGMPMQGMQMPMTGSA